jgi:hypothetical protein
MRFFRAHQDQLARKPSSEPSSGVAAKSERSEGIDGESAGNHPARMQQEAGMNEDNDWNTRFVPEVLPP